MRKNDLLIKIGLSVSYASVLVLMLLEWFSQPKVEPVRQFVTHETGLSILELVVIGIVVVFLLGLILLYSQSGIYILFLRFFHVSKNQRTKVFPAVVLSMCLVGSIFLMGSMFVDITHPVILFTVPAAVLLLNSLLFYLLRKDKKGFSIIFALSIAMYAVNSLLNQI